MARGRELVVPPLEAPTRTWPRLVSLSHTLTLARRGSGLMSSSRGMELARIHKCKYRCSSEKRCYYKVYIDTTSGTGHKNLFI